MEIDRIPKRVKQGKKRKKLKEEPTPSLTLRRIVVKRVQQELLETHPSLFGSQWPKTVRNGKTLSRI